MHLVVGTPCYGGLVTQRYMQSVCALLLDAKSSGITVTIEMIGYESLIPRARNTLVATFLDTSSATHLIFIDADIGFTVDAVVRMLALKEEVVAGMYPLKLVDYGPAVAERVAAGGEPAVRPDPLRRACWSRRSAGRRSTGSPPASTRGAASC